MKEEKLSLIFPYQSDPNPPEYKALSEETIHNLGLDAVVPKLSAAEPERAYILRVISHMTADPRVAEYRAEVFEDILHFPDLRERMVKILDKIEFLRSYGTFKKDYEESASAFELIHRLEEINDYIICVEAIHECLTNTDIKSRGLKNLKKYVDDVYTDNAFAELKEDIGRVKGSTSDLKSITLGINLNDRFEAESIGVISINNKSFTKSGVIGAFSDVITARRDHIQDGNEWKENYKYQPFDATASDIAASADAMGRFMIAATGPIGMLTMAAIPKADSTVDVTRYMGRIVNHMLFLTVRKLKSVLNKYVNITITDITDLIPEFMYYIRWAEYIEKMKEAGFVFRRPRVNLRDPSEILSSAGDRSDAQPAEDVAETVRQQISEKETDSMNAVGIYNLLLAQSHAGEEIDIVTNDLKFNRENLVYILTGANRGGKTTITAAIGQLYILAQGGIYIPGHIFEYDPVDCIYTHFPADEDKTMDLGRLGEECKRFKQIYSEATGKSLMLLNETFSTTSFEEGYYIARDAVRAILRKGCRTIYNTHMHKLARDIDEINASVSGSCNSDAAVGSGSGQSGLDAQSPRDGSPDAGKCQSLIVKTDGANRSFKIAVAPPAGLSYAEDIAKKYGVTYDMLTESL
ncbi:MAG: DNA mismatch repair protein [Lachnospiraceae bacterium]|nr:DNA mismatch repair protein [Lachnospiraceae bacterium]